MVCSILGCVVHHADKPPLVGEHEETVQRRHSALRCVEWRDMLVLPHGHRPQPTLPCGDLENPLV